VTSRIKVRTSPGEGGAQVGWNLGRPSGLRGGGWLGKDTGDQTFLGGCNCRLVRGGENLGDHCPRLGNSMLMKD